MKNKRRIVGLLVAAVLATLGTVALVGYVQSAKDRALADERLVDVYVVDDAIPQGAAAETIVASVSIEQIPARLQQPGAISDLGELGELVAATELLPGDQLLAARLVPERAVSDDMDGRVQVSALLTPERAVGGAIERGDLVGVYLSFDPFEIDVAGPGGTGAAGDAALGSTAGSVPPVETDADDKTPNLTRLEFQHVLVTNVQTTNAPAVSETEDDGGASDDAITQVSGDQFIVTLALTPEQSERFVFAAEFGHVWLANEPASVSDDGTRLVTLGNVFEVVH